MAEALALLATPAVEKITKDAYKFCTKKYHEVYGVEKELEKLQSNLSAIAAMLADFEQCTKKPNVLIDWLTKLRDAALDAEDILETYSTDASLRGLKKHPAILDWLNSQLNAATEFKLIVTRIENIFNQRKIFKNLEKHGVQPVDPSSDAGLREHTPNLQESIVGRQEEKEEVIQWLISHETDNNGRVPVYPIMGMGGVGKTTLAQLVYNDERVFKKKVETSRFRNAAWVSVTVDFNVDRILKEIATRLTEMPHEKVSRTSILLTIQKVLDGKPFLLVLDDVWINDRLAGWEELYPILCSFPSGSKVLVTSRFEAIAPRLGATNSYNLGLLPEPLCWDLFCKHVYLGDKLGKRKEEIGREIIKKCGLLPIAVKAMAAILRTMDTVDQWERVKENDIWATAVVHGDSGLSSIRPVLIMSYDYLPSAILKECFAYSSIFPKGHMFDKNELVKLWIAQGYIQHPGRGVNDTLEQLGGDYFKKLQNRSFFQLLEIDSKERYKMHDLFHDLANEVSKSSQQIENTSTSVENTCRHVSFLCNDIKTSILNQLLGAQKLRTFLTLPASGSTNYGQALNKIFQSLRYMRVLDLSSTNLSNLPKSIKHMKLLRYLDLSRTEIRLLPKSICKLLNLQVLKLLGCSWLQELPNDLGNLKELRYLELDEMFWFKCCKLPPRLGGLTNLRNLHYFHVYPDSGYGIEELKSMKYLEGLLHISKLENTSNAKEAQLREKKGITKLMLEWSEGDATPQDRTKQEEILENLEPHQGLQEFQIEQYKGSRLPNWLRTGMLQNLYKISFNHCTNCKTLSLGPLPHLQELIVKGMLELEEWPEMTSTPSLTSLTISHCPKLQSLPRYSFINVQAMKIKQCYALKALPVMPFLTFLTLVNNDLLEDWSEVSMSVQVDQNREQNVCNILDHSRNPMGMIYSFQEGIEVPQLRIAVKKIEGLEDGRYQLYSFFNLVELKLVNCPRMQTLPQSFSPQKLWIRSCPSLQSLPSQPKSQRLQYLEVDNCNGPSLIQTMQRSSSLDALTISNIRNMTSLPRLPDFQKLRTLHIHSCQDLGSLSHEDGFLPTLTTLKFFSISECQNLVKFPDEMLPTSIECLIIKNCSELQSFHGTNNNYLTNLAFLKDLCLENCPKLESLPEMLPDSLQHLRIQGCPLLTQQCSNELGGRYWDMISKVADMELDTNNTSESKQSCACFTFK